MGEVWFFFNNDNRGVHISQVWSFFFLMHHMYSVLQWLIEKATVLKRLDPSDAVWAAFLCNLAYLHQIIIVLLLRLCYFYIFGLYWIKNMTFNMTAADGAFSPVTTSLVLYF